MASINEIALYGDIYFNLYRESIKDVFGNRRNFMRYLYENSALQDWRDWNKWLISLGYREV